MLLSLCFQVNTQNALLRNLSIAIKALLKALTCLLYVVVLIFVSVLLCNVCHVSSLFV